MSRSVSALTSASVSNLYDGRRGGSILKMIGDRFSVSSTVVTAQKDSGRAVQIFRFLERPVLRFAAVFMAGAFVGVGARLSPPVAFAAGHTAVARSPLS